MTMTRDDRIYRDWFNLRCGDYITAKEGRHIGRVEAINGPSSIRVRWIDTRFLEQLAIDQIHKLTTAELIVEGLRR